MSVVLFSTPFNECDDLHQMKVCFYTFRFVWTCWTPVFADDDHHVSNPVAATKPAGWFQHCFNPSNEKKSPTSSSLNLRFNHCTDLKMLSPHDLSLHQWFMVKFPHVFQCLALPKRREFREEAAVTMRWTSDVFDLLLRMHEEQPGGPSCAWKLAKFVVQLEIPALWLWLIMNCIYWTIFNQKTSM